MWAIFRRKSCHENYSLWNNRPRWLIFEFLLESRQSREREMSSLLVHALTTLLVFSLSVFLFTLHFFFLISMLPFFFLIFLLLFFLALSYLLFFVISRALPSFTVHSQGPFILPVVIGFTILPLNYFCLGIGVLPRPLIGLSVAQPSPLAFAGCVTFHSRTKEFCFVFLLSVALSSG